MVDPPFTTRRRAVGPPVPKSTTWEHTGLGDWRDVRIHRVDCLFTEYSLKNVDAGRSIVALRLHVNHTAVTAARESPPIEGAASTEVANLVDDVERDRFQGVERAGIAAVEID
jgi:hypothetical protein